MTEVKIGVDNFGTLFAIFPTGEERTILIDVHDRVIQHRRLTGDICHQIQHYGILFVENVPVPSEEGE